MAGKLQCGLCRKSICVIQGSCSIVAKQYVGQCTVCGKSHGYFQRVTYEGAPDGGVTVHGSCLARFFEELERKQWQEDVKNA
jgi:hypothetical protein